MPNINPPLNTAPPVLAALAICKGFAGTRVLDDVSFDLFAGEVHAIVGENGAGKSTLMNILSGVIAPDAGEIRVDGRGVRFDSPTDAQQSGIGTVFQELSLVDVLSVAENLFPNRAPVGRGGLIRWRALREQALALLTQLNVRVDPGQLVQRLPTSTRQLVEIAKALSLSGHVLIMDEPTSALTPDEVAALFEAIRRLKSQGVGIIYISHHLNEVFALADRITVLRDGRKIETMAASQTSREQVVRKMVGRDLAPPLGAGHRTPGDFRLRARRLALAGHFADVDLDLRAGEIVGLAGLAGCGRNELAQTLAGLLRPSAGSVEIDGKPRRLRGIHEAISLGVAYLPAERKTEGLFLEQSIAENVVASTLRRFSRHGLLSSARRDTTAAEQCRRLDVRTTGIHQAVGRLSGGNQQKVLLAKWLLTNPKTLIIEEPTRGIDIGAKAEIHALLRRLAAEGTAVLVISSDLPELLAVCDRIVVMHAGRATGEMKASEATEDRVMHLAVGAAPAVETEITQLELQ